MIFCFLLFAYELGLTHLLIEGEISLLMLLSAHILGVAAFYLFLKQKKFNLKRINLYFITLLLTSVTGVFGAGTGFLSGLLFLYAKNKATNDLSNLGMEDARIESDEEPELIASFSARDIKSKSHVLPFKEILTAGNINQKIEALSKISQHYRPEFAPALLIAKKDKINNIRVLSASTIAKIDQTFTRRYKNLSAKLDQTPDSPLILLNIARHASAYADCGVLDSFRENHFREKSIDFFVRYTKLRPADKESQLTLAKIYLKNSESDKAVTIFQDLLLHKVKMGMVDLFWYLEALYESGNFTLIRAQIKQFEKQGALEGDKDLFVLDNILKPWAQGHIKSGGKAA